MKKIKQPSVKIIGKVHSNVYFCKDAVLVHLTHGLDRLCWKRDHEKYELYFKDQLVVHANIPSCGTCGDSLWRGYGEKITPAECINTRDRINEGFQNLEQSVKDIAPLLGLFADGDYVIADYDLHPCISGMHFWNGEYNQHDLLHDHYIFSGGSLIYDSPLCLFPTERAAYLNQDRVMYYKNRLSEGNHSPRAIAYYLSGCVALLLDGHHKAAAAAWEGELARCLVIMHADMTGSSEWMSLNQNRKYVDPMSLNDREGNHIGKICTVSEISEQKIPVEKTVLELDMESDQKAEIEWGSIPETFCQNIKNYQNVSSLSDGMMIPRNKIRQEFDNLIHHTDPENDKERLMDLLRYCRLFPDNKWITKSQREWMETMRNQIYYL